MPGQNLQRMIQLAEEFFDAKNDPEQLTIDEGVMRRLKEIHAATTSEETAPDGPVAWILVIPTIRDVMLRFVAGEMSEKELLDSTPPGVQYGAVYLCSALVLPEYRGKGLARRLTLQALQSIQEQHPIRDLFYWAFSAEGERLAASLAAELRLGLHARKASDL